MKDNGAATNGNGTSQAGVPGPNPNRKRNSKKTAKERLQEFWSVFDKEDTVLVVISADPDALAGAMAVKRLLRYRVKAVTIAYPNEIRRLNNLVMLELLKIPAERLHTVKPTEFSKRVILDSQPPHLPSFENIPFDVVLDHHPATKGWAATFVDIRKDYGATASMMVEYLRAAGIRPSVALATALFYAIKVDTQNFEKKVTLADAISFRYLFNLANLNLVRKIELSSLRRSELNYFRTALKEMKLSKQRLYSHVGKVPSPDILVLIADFLKQVHEAAWVFVSGIHNDKLVVIFRCDGYKKNAGRLAEKTFGQIGCAGGHRESARAEVPLKNMVKDASSINTNTLIRLTNKHM
ncbi:MAG TPA: phosphoethanolamine methyltransferase [Desulfurivibrio alkaliphilus]|uniref:Phosphoethanolamine methyltransferase n=1 Tax=Desulfurivibrio alkaliphilus TaxID=427923 RepID=A0A7C2XVR7_9BACT|nr:phosphoethanolamine methyltransferase [Desulfurivibrio alkaliphilus]